MSGEISTAAYTQRYCALLVSSLFVHLAQTKFNHLIVYRERHVGSLNHISNSAKRLYNDRWHPMCPEYGIHRTGTSVYCLRISNLPLFQRVA
jgi:hypothetical protein